MNIPHNSRWTWAGVCLALPPDIPMTGGHKRAGMPPPAHNAQHYLTYCHTRRCANLPWNTLLLLPWNYCLLRHGTCSHHAYC